MTKLTQFLKANLKGHNITATATGCRFFYKGRLVILDGKDAIGLASQTFFELLSDGMDVKGRRVVDIGASIGDTAIFFALNGAKEVIAYEPFPSFYDMASNIEQNDLDWMITPVRAAVVGGCFGSVKVPDEATRKSTAKLSDLDGQHGKNVPIIDLDGVVNMHRLDNACLKMDCEGCEHAVIATASRRALRRFKEILIEVHGEGGEKIDRKLRWAGFKTKIRKDGAILAKRVAYYQRTGKKRKNGVVSP